MAESVVEVTTWYANGERLPWRLAKRGNDGLLTGEIRCESFAQMMHHLGETWAYEMPEPLTRRPTSSIS
jgi:hypothetical protein